MKNSRSERTLSTSASLATTANKAAQKPFTNILKMINRTDLQDIRSGNLAMCKNLRFFMQYPEPVQDRLLEIA